METLPGNKLVETSMFRTIPLSVFENNNLEYGARLLFMEIYFLSLQTGSCWASNKHFAKTLGTTERTIRRWLSNLEENFVIFIVEEKVEKNKTKRFLTPRVKHNHVVKSKPVKEVPNEIKKKL
jgi:predicted AAA+ superfamily ATPase